jgi:hypothetical protein
MSLKETLRSLVPRALRLWRQRRLEMRSLLAATRPMHPRTCPLCSYHGLFTHYGRPPRLDAQCPACSSLERHRLFWLWFGGDNRKLKEPVLHFAPEPVLERRLRQIYKHYSTASITGKADLRLNIERIDRPSGSVGTIICNHILEHVADAHALRELHRVLVDDGQLVTSVPIVEGWSHTYEDPAITDPAARELHFGQADHIRYYGRDFRDRLRAAGFHLLEEVTAEGRSVVDHGLQRGEKLFVCRRDGV